MVATAVSVNTRTDVEAWVDATPFRAQLRHLMTVSGMSSSSVALLVGISPGFAYRLLYGRGGRPLRRISPETARKLLRLTSSEARAVRWRMVPARTTLRHLDRLRTEGWSQIELAELLGLSPSALGDLLARGGSCTQLMALSAAAEVSLLLTPLPSALTGDRRAA